MILFSTTCVWLTAVTPLQSATITVPAGGNLQAALNSANPGDTVVLQRGATFTGNFILPAKTGDTPITLTASAMDLLPPAGVRVRPSDAVNMPKVVTPNSMAALATADAASNYVIAGIEFTAAPGVWADTLVNLGSTNATSVDQQAANIRIDRVYVHGDRVKGAKRGIGLNSVATTIANSYISDIMSTSQDAQAICGWNGPGPYTIVNNHLEASGENVMFGGATPAIFNLVPSDIQILKNHFFKPLSWNPADPSYAGTAWCVKNILEFKNARRVTVTGNLLENNWVSCQSGYAVLFTVRTQSGAAPWAVVENINFTGNIIKNSPSAINILGIDDNGQGKTSRILIKDNLLLQIRDTLYQILRGADSISIDHNTAVDNGRMVSLDCDPSTAVAITNNISLNGLYGVTGTGTSPGISSLNAFLPGGVFFKNVMVGGSAAKYPAGNFFPSTIASVGFVNAAAGDYHLLQGSAYVLAGTDLKDLGADINTVNQGTAGVLDGTPGEVPVTLALSPSSIGAAAGQAQQFAAAVTGNPNTAVTWSINPPVGTITDTGLYVAPATVPSPQTVAVIATSAADRWKSAEAMVSLIPVSVAVTPASVLLANAQTQQFTPTVSATSNPAVTWSISPSVGTISPSGLYTAPAFISVLQSVTVKATSVADPAKSAIATINLTPTGILSGPIFVNSGGPSYTDSSGAVWTADTYYIGGSKSSTGATITNTTSPALYQTMRVGSFTYQFPVVNGYYNLTMKFAEPSYAAAGQRIFNVLVNGQAVLSNFDVYARAGARYSAIDQRVTVLVTNGQLLVQFVSVKENPICNAISVTNAPVDVSIAPGTATISAAATQQFTATVRNTANPAVNWNISPAIGSISPSGSYTAPASAAAPQTVIVRATSAADPTRGAEATLTILPAGVDSVRINAGGQAYVDSQGRLWAADAYYNGGSAAGRSVAVPGADVETVYQSLRSGTFSYRIPAVNGAYALTLKFAEFNGRRPGQIVFNVVVNGQTALANFDPYAAAGNKFAAVDRVLPVTVTGGQLNVEFQPVNGEAICNAIALEPQTSVLSSLGPVSTGSSASPARQSRPPAGR